MRRLAAVLTLSLAIAPGLARGQGEYTQAAGDAPPQPGVEQFRGSFHQSIPIEVPPFHGLEPDLALVYDSAAGNGWTGVGWALSGDSEILRASPGRGLPRYGQTDIFLLDGVELVPGTGLGGTHREQFESFRRIARDATADTWTVTEKNGIRSVYQPLEVTASGTFRWALRTVTDPHGNQVTYDHACGTTGCFLTRVAYNGATVTFVRQTRPDRITYATGASMASIADRLARIEVRVGTSLARIYQLEYATSSGTGRSILARIRHIGRDAVVNADGSVSGTALPAHDLDYASTAPTLAAAASWLTQSGTWKKDQAQYADVDGDGRIDAVHRKTDNTIWVSLSRGNLFAPAVQWQSGLGGTYLTDQVYLDDVDGDGRADLLFRKSDNTIWVGKSTGTSFTTATRWSTMGGAFLAGQAQYGDVDGDGMSDLVFRVSGSFRVSRSTGTGFAAYAVWATVTDSGTVYPDQNKLADLDGDGKLDLVFRKSADNTVWVARSTGTGFMAPAQWLSLGGGYRPGQLQLGDFNGDGAADLAFRPVTCTTRTKTCNSCGNSCGPCACAADEIKVSQTACSYANQSCGGGDNAEALLRTTSTCRLCTSTGEIQVALSTGSGFQPLAVWSSLLPTSYKPGQVKYADLNGDGRADLLVQNDAQELRVALSLGTGFATPALVATLTESFESDQVQYGDADGDGRADLLFRGEDQIYRVALALPRQAPDALIGIDTPLGGRIAVSYRPSSAWVNLNNPPLVHTVDALTVSDGRGSSATTTFAYQGGKWLASERRFLGFRTVSQVLDGLGTVRQTVFHQHAQCRNRPESSTLRDAQGNLYESRSFLYSESASSPYQSLVTERWQLECERTTTCRRRVTQLAYDGFGNPVEIREHGNYDVAGDETTTEIGFVPNQSAYIVSLPAFQNLYEGIGVDPERLRARAQHLYDGASAYTIAPTRGDETGSRAWNSTDGSYVATAQTFDAKGNRISETGPTGARSTTSYDTTYLVFPIRRCNALGHCAATDWDPVVARAIRETDPNGLVTQIAFDPLGRVVRTTYPNGGTRQTSYLGTGQPTAQYIQTALSDGSADGLWARSYLDGLGRTYLEVVEGDHRRQSIFAADVPLRIRQQSSWFAPGETARYDTFSHDGAGRVTRVLHPDGSDVVTTYAVGSVSVRDESGHERIERFDALGRVSAEREKLGSTWRDTTYAHDPLGRLIRIVDPAGNSSSATHDSLGRRLRACDPDRGCSTSTYNPAGSLLSTIDARGQTVAWTYDALQRPLSKTGGYSWIYDQTGRGASKGRVTTRRAPRGEDQLSYDFAGRVTSETLCRDGACIALGRTYDTTAEGRLRSVVYPDETVTYSYGTTGQLSAVSGYASALVHDARGQLVSAAFANGTSESATYDPVRYRLIQTRVSKGTASLYQADYQHGPDGLVTRVAIQQPGAAAGLQTTLTLGHDELHRLIAVSGSQAQSFQYDALGNLVVNSRVGTYEYGNTAHVHAVSRVVPASGSASTYSYDLSGNLLSGGGRAFTWDAEGRITRIVQGGQTTTMAYGADGERLIKSGPVGTTITFGPLVERKGATTVKYIFAGGRRIARRVGTGTKYFFHQDHLSSVRLVTDGTGIAAQRYDYRAFGEVATTQGSLDNGIRFTDHKSDDETGLVYMNARYYDPVLGRFVSADSIVPDLRDPQALNRYSYVNNNPMRFRDPTGHSPNDGPNAGVHNDGGYGHEGYSGSSAGNPDNRGGGFHPGGGNGGGSGDGRPGGSPDMSKIVGDFSPGTMVFSYHGVRIVRSNTSISLTSVIEAAAIVDQALERYPGQFEANAQMGQMSSITVVADDQWNTHPMTKDYPNAAGLYYPGTRAAYVPENALADKPITRSGYTWSGDWVTHHEILGHLTQDAIPGSDTVVHAEFTRATLANDFISGYAGQDEYENFAEETAGYFTGSSSLSPAASGVMHDFWGEP